MDSISIFRGAMKHAYFGSKRFRDRNKLLVVRINRDNVILWFYQRPYQMGIGKGCTVNSQNIFRFYILILFGYSTFQLRCASVYIAIIHLDTAEIVKEWFFINAGNMEKIIQCYRIYAIFCKIETGFRFSLFQPFFQLKCFDIHTYVPHTACQVYILVHIKMAMLTNDR